MKAYLVHAGLEPLEFTNLFPQWEVREDVRKINEAEGRERDEITSVEDLLSKLLKTKYTWEELQERPLPEGVDPLKMEQFLQDDEFEVRGRERQEHVCELFISGGHVHEPGGICCSSYLETGKHKKGG